MDLPVRASLPIEVDFARRDRHRGECSGMRMSTWRLFTVPARSPTFGELTRPDVVLQRGHAQHARHRTSAGLRRLSVHINQAIEFVQYGGQFGMLPVGGQILKADQCSHPERDENICRVVTLDYSGDDGFDGSPA